MLPDLALFASCNKQCHTVPYCWSLTVCLSAIFVCILINHMSRESFDSLAGALVRASASCLMHIFVGLTQHAVW